MENSVSGIEFGTRNSAREGTIQTIDLGSGKGFIVMTASDGEASTMSIQFPLKELKVSVADLEYVGQNTKVTYKLRIRNDNRLEAYEVAPIEHSLYYAEIYGVGGEYCRVLIWENQTLANVNLTTLTRVVPHHLGLHIKENCIVALHWTETPKALREKRLPVVHMIELHETKSAALASLERETSSASMSAIPGATASRQNMETAPEPESCPRVHRLASKGIMTEPSEILFDGCHDHETTVREGFPSTPPLTFRNPVQSAYLAGVRDGALGFQQLITPYYGAMDHPDVPLKFKPAQHIGHRD